MQRYYILLKASGASGWPAWFPYHLKAANAEQAVEKAKKIAMSYYPEFERFEVQTVGVEGGDSK